jgi:type II secretory pathway component HofQ
MRKSFLFPLFVALALGLLDPRAERDAIAAPANLPVRSLDLELKQADVKNVLQLLGQASQRAITLDPCVQGTIDLKLANAPLPLIYDAIAIKLGLTYEDRDGGVFVGCAGEKKATPEAELRVSLHETGAPLAAVLDHLAKEARLEGIDDSHVDTVRVPLSITLEKVRLSTALTALSDASGLRISVAGGRLVVRP